MENLNLMLGIIASTVAILGGGAGYFLKQRKKKVNKIKSGDNSTNIIGNYNQINKDTPNEK